MRLNFQQILSERKQKSLGFTIVELLIVIVVIGILAAIVIVAFNGVTQRANATGIADGLKKIEKSMRLYITAENLPRWPVEGDMSGGRLTDMIANVPGFTNYIQAPPKVSGIASTSWRYDFDGDTYNGCSDQANGASVYVASMTDQALAQLVDEIMDDGNLSCGKVRWNAGSNLMLSVSNNGSL